jgi:hypothetical protein
MSTPRTDLNPSGLAVKRPRARRALAVAAASVAMAAGLAAYGLSPAGAATTAPAAQAARAHGSGPFTFALKASPGITQCLPHARGLARVTPGSLNDVMTVTLYGMPAGSDFDLFVIQQPNKPFGVSWYQSDIHVGENGTGSATVRGIFDKETFSVSPGGTTTFAPTHQFHLGVWFNDPGLPFRLGCEPGQAKPVVTPFNGEQHAGIQVVNTANFPDDAGPLSEVHR